jgi:hypothetical protein
LARQRLQQVSHNNAFDAFLLEFTNGFKQTVIYGDTELAEQIIDFYARKVVLRGCPKPKVPLRGTYGLIDHLRRVRRATAVCTQL